MSLLLKSYIKVLQNVSFFRDILNSSTSSFSSANKTKDKRGEKGEFKLVWNEEKPFSTVISLH